MIFKNITDIKAAVEAYREAHPAPAVPAGEQRITAALCDMDGTLYDSMSRHSAAWFRLMTELGVECERDEFYLYEGMTGANTIRHLFKRAFDTVPSDEEVAELYHRKTQYFCELPKPDVMPGAQELIRFCVSHGVRPVLVTGSGQNTLINRLDADYDRAFSPDLRVTSHIVKRGKPDPEPYLMALKWPAWTPRAPSSSKTRPSAWRAAHAPGSSPSPSPPALSPGRRSTRPALQSCFLRCPSAPNSFLNC